MAESAQRVSVTRMRELVKAGDARPMFVEFDVGPTSYDGQWWHIPNDAPQDADYEPADPGLAESFEQTRGRLDKIDAFLARPT